MADVPVSPEGHPLFIPADDGVGTWNLVQGSSCPVTQTASADTFEGESKVPLAVIAAGGVFFILGLL